MATAVPLVQTKAAGRLVALAIPRAKKAAVRSSIRICKLTNPRLEASYSAIARGALREPGLRTKSVIPCSMNSRITFRANSVLAILQNYREFDFPTMRVAQELLGN